MYFVSELDLDFLERRQHESANNENQDVARSPIEISPESVDRVKVILLGAPAVGKTSIIQVNIHYNSQASISRKDLIVDKTNLVENIIAKHFCGLRSYRQKMMC